MGSSPAGRGRNCCEALGFPSKMSLSGETEAARTFQVTRDLTASWPPALGWALGPRGEAGEDSSGPVDTTGAGGAHTECRDGKRAACCSPRAGQGHAHAGRGSRRGWRWPPAARLGRAIRVLCAVYCLLTSLQTCSVPGSRLLGMVLCWGAWPGGTTAVWGAGRAPAAGRAAGPRRRVGLPGQQGGAAERRGTGSSFSVWVGAPVVSPHVLAALDACTQASFSSLGDFRSLSGVSNQRPSGWGPGHYGINACSSPPRSERPWALGAQSSRAARLRLPVEAPPGLPR